jgi:anti-anti-sigma regulatory factor
MNSITLPVRCDRAAAEALWPELAAAMGDAATRIDATAVEHVGQAMLQLLVSARRSGGGAVIASSPALRDAAALTGLTAELFEASQA